MTTRSPMNRRGFLATGAAFAVGLHILGQGDAAHAAEPAVVSVDADDLKAVISATANCQRIGEACLALSVRQLGQGMTEMTRCQESCINMLALTDAMLTVSSHGTASADIILALASATAKACRECEAACSEFKADAYRACAKSCRETAFACERLGGS